MRSKRTLGWRTLLIIPELEAEVDKLHDPEIIALSERIDTKRRKRDELDEWIDRLRLGILRSGKDETAKRAAAEEEIALAMEEVHVAREGILKDVEALHMAFGDVRGAERDTRQPAARPRPSRRPCARRRRLRARARHAKSG